MSSAQPRPGQAHPAPGGQTQHGARRVAGVQRPGSNVSLSPMASAPHPAHGNTDTYRPHIGHIVLPLDSDWLMMTSPAPTSVSPVPPSPVTLTHVSRTPEADCDVL